MTENRQLTDEEVAQLTSGQRLLKDSVETQCIEQVRFLRKEIYNDSRLSLEAKNHLLGGLNNGGFKVSLFRVTDKNADRKLVVQVVYAIDDDLLAYLSKPKDQLPESLVDFLKGGITLESKATAVDLMPQTGKTKVR